MSEITILFSGRLSWRKGVDRVRALADYLETVGDASLNIACNNGNGRSYFQERAKTEIQTGLSLDDMPAFYRSGDVLYFPTRYEGFSMATLEALACGIPVAGSRFAIPEEIRHYDFVEILEDAPPDKTLKHLRALAEKNRERRAEIHAIITRDFGRAQYEEKLLGFVREAMGDKTKQIVIVSLNGIGNAGGVERVCYYLVDILRWKGYTVRVLEKLPVRFGRLDALFQPIIASMRLAFIRDKIVFANSWQAFLYPVDLSVHHGTTAGYTTRVPSSKTFGSRVVSLMEKISARAAKRILAVSRNAARELVSLYGADERKITVLNNFVDETIFHP